MSMAESAGAVFQLAENGLPAQSLAALSEEINETVNRIMAVVGDTQNDYIMGAYQQLQAAKEDVERARAAVEGCRESLRSYAGWVLGGA
ncbi:hypothetical protein [Krasilnikovia sp. M28-CT-15]|uniref:hypothetical protein n=1 Tax=Krasilnikovia sp. M28-CT-15 TaxID=3373540 RepID=UPI003875D9B4